MEGEGYPRGTRYAFISSSVADERAGSNTINPHPDLARPGFELHLSHFRDYNVITKRVRQP
jgi:hypothetical protein